MLVDTGRREAIKILGGLVAWAAAPNPAILEEIQATLGAEDHFITEYIIDLKSGPPGLMERYFAAKYSALGVFPIEERWFNTYERVWEEYFRSGRVKLFVKEVDKRLGEVKFLRLFRDLASAESFVAETQADRMDQMLATHGIATRLSGRRQSTAEMKDYLRRWHENKTYQQLLFCIYAPSDVQRSFAVADARVTDRVIRDFMGG